VAEAAGAVVHAQARAGGGPLGWMPAVIHEQPVAGPANGSAAPD
jgi:hypothetical protein